DIVTIDDLRPGFTWNYVIALVICWSCIGVGLSYVAQVWRLHHPTQVILTDVVEANVALKFHCLDQHV
ncbi:MAG: hypothetical protein HQM09_25230, partial [Candidatus Riflebacteria bacterium]|nr:hypothetical protein [Candidatus Riflebacteria bacterium]